MGPIHFTLLTVLDFRFNDPAGFEQSSKVAQISFGMIGKVTHPKYSGKCNQNPSHCKSGCSQSTKLDQHAKQGGFILNSYYSLKLNSILHSPALADRLQSKEPHLQSVYDMVSTVNFVFILCERVLLYTELYESRKNHFHMKFFKFGHSPKRIKKKLQNGSKMFQEAFCTAEC